MFTGKKPSQYLVNLMVKIHFITVGDATVRMHLAGIAKYGADEVVLFGPTNKKLEQIILHLRRLGVHHRTVTVDGTYIDAYRKANEEAAGAFTNNSSIAVNASCRAGVTSSGVERSIVVQLFFFHRRNPGSFASALLYFITPGKRLRFDMVPIWNTHSELHNDLVEMLVDAPRSLSLAEMWEIFQERPDPGAFEAFRKGFREFRLWFKDSPCFKENLSKSPRYKIEF